MNKVDPRFLRRSGHPPDPNPADPDKEGILDPNALLARTERLERQIRRMGVAIFVLLAMFGYVLFTFVPGKSLHQDVTVKNTLVESEQFRLVDSSGRPQMLMKMYSEVPVVQIFDSKGETRISMGLRFDETPFIDLSDPAGRTRAAVEISKEGQPSFKLFDENGSPTFQVK